MILHRWQRVLCTGGVPAVAETIATRLAGDSQWIQATGIRRWVREPFCEYAGHEGNYGLPDDLRGAREDENKTRGN